MGFRGLRSWLIVTCVLLFAPAMVFAARIVSITTCEKVSKAETLPLDIKSTFASDAPEIHCVVVLEDAAAGTRLKGIWIAIDAISTPNYEIDATVFNVEKPGDARIDFSISKPDKGWPPGNYKLDLYIDDKLITPVPFVIAAESQPPPAPGSAAVPATTARVVSISTCERVSESGTIPLNVRDRFAVDVQEIHTVVVVEGARKGDRFKGNWVAVDAIATPNYDIDSKEVTTGEDGDARLHFSISKPDKGWPPGNYRFDFYVGDELTSKAPFVIGTAQGPAPAPAAPSAAPPTAAPAARSVSGGSMDFGPVQPDPDRAWTLVVYLDGDNNLEPFGLRDLDEMEKALPEKGVDVIVLADRAEGYSNEEGNWTDARVFRVRRDAEKGLKSEVIASPGELNMGDPTVLQSFLAAALKTFPAKRHGLILWDHGGGWAAHASDEKAPGAKDEFDKLTLPELRSAISGSLEKTSVKKLDLVGFDMCLMAQLETAYELEGLVEVMVGSEATEPGDGWPYEAVLPLFGDSRLATKDVAKGIVKAYDDYYRPRGEPIATQSALDVENAGNVVQALDAFLTRIESSLPTTWQTLTRALFFSESYSDLGEVRRGPGALMSVDLGDTFWNFVGAQPDLRSAPEYAALQNAAGKFVLETRNSPRHRKSLGVAIYAPFRKDLLNPDYGLTRFAQQSRWPKTLQQLYEIQDKNPTRPRIKGVQTVSLLRQKPVSEVIQLGQDGFAFVFEGKNVLWSFANIGVRDKKENRTLIFQKSILRREPQQEELTVREKSREELLQTYTYPDGEHTVGFRYDATRRLISNGEKAFPATTDETDVGDLNAHIISVPAIYEHPKVGKLFATLYFNWLWRAAAVTVEVPQPDGSYVYAQIEPQPDADIHLLLQSLPDKGDPTYAVSGTLKWKEGLFLTVDLVPPGEYEVLLALESLNGLASSTRHEFKVATRDDDLLKGIENAAEELTLENFLGEWEFIDAETWFKEGRMVSIGGFAKYEPHPKHKGLLKLSLYKPRGKDLFPDLDIVEVIQQVGLPHLRRYVLDAEGMPRSEYGYQLGFPVFDYKDGQYLMLDLDLATGELGVKVKRSGPTPKLQTPAATPQDTGAGQGETGTSLAGMWQSAGGEVVVFSGTEWLYYEDGAVADGGVYQVQGNRITAQSAATGETETYLFQISGNQLLLQDSSGQVLQFQRSQ